MRNPDPPDKSCKPKAPTPPGKVIYLSDYLEGKKLLRRRRATAKLIAYAKRLQWGRNCERHQTNQSNMRPDDYS